jgi:hypothetical protein
MRVVQHQAEKEMTIRDGKGYKERQSPVCAVWSFVTDDRARLPSTPGPVFMGLTCSVFRIMVPGSMTTGRPILSPSFQGLFFWQGARALPAISKEVSNATVEA